jgi:PAS domain S-box-containing protein
MVASKDRFHSGHWFELIVERIPDALLMADRDGRIIYVNRNIEALFGYARSELLGRPLEILVPPRFRARHPAHVAGFFSDPKARLMGAGRELFGLRKDGSEVPVEIGLSAIDTDEGVFTLASIIDITERKRTEERFRLVVEAAPNAMLMIDKSGRITLVNRNAENLFGYSRAELIGEQIDLLVPQRQRARHPSLVANFFSEPKARSMGAGRELFGRRKDGTEVPLEIGLNPIQTPDGLLTLASIINITSRKRAEEVEQQMTALVESAADAILTKTLDGIIRSWNPGAERLLGYRADDIIGQSGTRLLPPDRQDEESMILGQIQKGHGVAHFETVRRKSDGSMVEVSLTISPIRDRLGSVIGASKIMRDITQRKRTEEELRRSNIELEKINAELDEFVYTASHDLRAPLTGVASVAQWILADDALLSAESRERLTLIQGRIERMKRLLNDIRDYARTGRYAQTSGPTLTAAALVAEVVATSHVPPGFLVRLDSRLEDIRVDRIPLEQVLHNLINNAIKHHDRQAGMVTVSAIAVGPMLRFSVIDDGPGVPAEYRESVFEMFKTLKPKDEVEGSGMGLALVKRVVGRLGGSCGLRPVDVGRGTHVWFDWPPSGQCTRGPE